MSPKVKEEIVNKEFKRRYSNVMNRVFYYKLFFKFTKRKGYFQV